MIYARLCALLCVFTLIYPRYHHGSYIVLVVLPDWTSAEEFHTNLSGKSCSGGQMIDLFSFCTLLQMNLSAAITSNLEEKGKFWYS